MTANQIQETILQQSDDALLITLPTTQRQACEACGSVSVAKRAHSEKTNTYYCPICKGDKPVKTVLYFTKNKTADPAVALQRHRAFWLRIYHEQLYREARAAPSLKQPGIDQELMITAEVTPISASIAVTESPVKNASRRRSSRQNLL